MDNVIFTHVEFLQHKFFPHDKVVVPAHNHHCFELNYVLNGNFIAESKGEKYECSKNTVLIFPPNVYHSHDSKSTFEVIYMGFYYNNLFGPIKQIQFDDKDEKILHILKKMESEFNNSDYYYEAVLSELQKLLIFTILRMQNPNVLSDYDVTLKYAISYIQEHYYEKIDIQSLAASLGYSYHHFRHVFKNNIDMPPSQFLFNQRLQNAMWMLRNTDLNIGEISEKCGFNSPAHLTTAFTSALNISPQQYRISDNVNLDSWKFLDQQS